MLGHPEKKTYSKGIAVIPMLEKAQLLKALIQQAGL